jgi:hypothetical protein
VGATRLYGVKSLKRSSDRRHPGNLGEEFRVAIPQGRANLCGQKRVYFPAVELIEAVIVSWINFPTSDI